MTTLCCVLVWPPEAGHAVGHARTPHGCRPDEFRSLRPHEGLRSRIVCWHNGAASALMWIKHQMYDGDALRPRSAELQGCDLMRINL